TLNIYGQVDSRQTAWFDALCASFPDTVRYAGVVPYDQSVDFLKRYFALLFPTYYEGEGFAGTLIDAMAAGVPVIASDWRYNAEIVIEGSTGFLFPTHSVDALCAVLLRAAENPEEWNRLKPSCLSRAADYQPSAALSVLISHLT
ncbi:MAG: glycosyltransferase, partial [Clostridia bacterium]|nr:glycosyltransferase [Clostridia bacterium]